jgi:hypothetical protein
MRTAVLIDERDRRIGKLMVPESCFVIKHNDALFVRTEKAIRPNPRLNAIAVVFEETQPFIRTKLEAI